MKRLLVALLGALFLPMFVQAQLLTNLPIFPKETDNLTIHLDATKGNQGLLGHTGEVYVHIGLITSASANGDDWKYVPFEWGTSPALGRATADGANKWTYTINNIRSFFNVTNAGESIRAIAILFRTPSGDRVQRNADGSNMYVQVYNNDPAVKILNPPFQPKFVREQEPITKNINEDITISAAANTVSTMNVIVNGTVVRTQASATSITHIHTLTTAGNTTIYVESIDGAVTKRDSVKFFVAGGTTVAPLPAGVKQGINYLPGNTSVVLVLFAPQKSNVMVIGEFPGSNWQQQSNYQMKKTPDGNYFWLQIDGLTAGTEYAYQFLVDGTLKIADPYAEKILDSYNNNDSYISPTTYPNLRPFPAGQSGIVSLLQTNAPAYTWTSTNYQRPDKRNLFVYELLVRDFVQAHDWNTLRDTIQYLKRLGVNAIELMPFNEFEGNESWGYNPDFYFAPDKYYGPKNTLKRFVDECHKNGIAVVMDIALNHAFGLSPMVQLYWDPARNRPATNNPWFNPAAHHSFNVGFDMNHESAATQYFFSRVVEHWLKEYRLDGFRFDLSKGFTQKQSCDENGGNCNFDNWNGYDASRIAIWKKYYDTLQLKSPGSWAILEHLGVDEEEKELAAYGMMLWGNINHQFSEASMGHLAESNFSRALHSVRGYTQPAIVSYMESHDEERMAFRNINYGAVDGNYNVKDTNTSLKRLALSAAFLMTIPGPKMIWQFGETGYEYSINYCPNGTISNDCRLSNKPIRWDYMQQQRRRDLYNTYSKLAELRYNGRYKDIFIANNITIEQELSAGFKWMKFRSATDSSMICVYGNFGTRRASASFRFPKAGIWYDYFTGEQVTATGNAQVIALDAGQWRVLVNRNPSGEEEPEEPEEPVASSLQASVAPNPMTSASMIRVNVPVAGPMQAALFNSHGKQVGVRNYGTVAAGVNTVDLPTNGQSLGPGIYLLQISVGNEQKTIKIVKP